jgi:beta-galactosidase/beta-glucuronidase
MDNSINDKSEYPRPQFVRNDWLNLNGDWKFKFDDNHIGEKQRWFDQTDFDQTIKVPFVYESKASGIGDEKFHSCIWYQKEITIPQQYEKKKIVLHFQAVDYLTKVWINGQCVGQHRGGNSAFSFDITNYTNELKPNRIVVMVEDSNSCYQPRGKQRWIDKNFGCWYVQNTGIWQTVWLEFLNQYSIDSVKMTPDIDDNSIQFEYRVASVSHGNNISLKTDIRFADQPVKQFTLQLDRSLTSLKIDLQSEMNEWKIKLWDPQNPHLYNVQFTLYHEEEIVDQVDSYFGMRKISIENGKVLLNNKPIYQKMILDQGYWQDSFLTPPSEEALIEDIDKIIEMGFNGVRKHQKLEDARFLYWCDKKGLLVWSEMAATYEYSDEAVENFTNEWMEIVQQHYNHPSIITWVPFNESWGVREIYTNRTQQRFTEAIYYLTKSFDPNRPVIVNDGWEHTISDIITLHDYEEIGEMFMERYRDKDNILTNPHNKHKYAMAQGYEYKGQPIILSEYGGIAFQSEDGWGYGNQVKSEEEFLIRYKSITEAIKKTDYICGFCYTQITDVQQEINGLLTEDRKPKIDLSKIKEINQM